MYSISFRKSSKEEHAKAKAHGTANKGTKQVHRAKGVRRLHPQDCQQQEVQAKHVSVNHAMG